jgi:hypothetical protein
MIQEMGVIVGITVTSAQGDSGAREVHIHEMKTVSQGNTVELNGALKRVRVPG